MPFITGGHVQYTRRVKTGDFEHKDVVVLLNWSAQEGEAQKTESFAPYVHDMARSECERIVAGKIVEAVAHPSSNMTTVMPPAGQSDAPKRGPGRPPKVQSQDTPSPANGSETNTISPSLPIDDLDGPVAKPAAKVEDDLGDVTGAQAHIDDKTLVEHITHTNQRIKNAPAIRALIGEFVGSTPPFAAKIPQERRQEFIDKLGALK